MVEYTYSMDTEEVLLDFCRILCLSESACVGITYSSGMGRELSTCLLHTNNNDFLTTEPDERYDIHIIIRCPGNEG